MGRLLTLAGLLLVLSLGCSTQLRNRDLEKAAKDWSMVIRASQVIPVYPLTEDLQPGDVFLVQVPIDKQQALYKERGFLPLDNLIHRIDPLGYKSFYRNSFVAGDADKPLPKSWLAPGESGAWSLAPNASFPTYSFSVQSGGGFSLALPVQGVPVGLSLLGGDAAQGTVTIADARTYGVDTVSLNDDVRAWAEDRREFLSQFEASADRQNYLRVVSRVYLTGRLNVSLQSSRNFAATASGGAPKPVDLLVPSAGSDPRAVTLDAYTKNIDALNKMIQGVLSKTDVGGVERLLPGGSVKVVAASAGSISLTETFSRPLIIGYLGFDIPIGAEGILGPPIPTHAVLEELLAPSPAVETSLRLLSTAALSRSYQILATRNRAGDKRAELLVRDLDKLGGLVPEKYPCNIFAPLPGGALSIQIREGEPLRSGAGNFTGVTTYKSQLITSINEIKLAQGNTGRRIEGFDARTPETETYLGNQLAANEQALSALNRGLREHVLLLNQSNDYANRIEE